MGVGDGCSPGPLRSPEHRNNSAALFGVLCRSVRGPLGNRTTACQCPRQSSSVSAKATGITSVVKLP